MATESNKERVDRELVELLNEVRVAIPAPRSSSRSSSASPSPSGYLAHVVAARGLLRHAVAGRREHRPDDRSHRVPPANFRDGDKERLLQVSTRMVLASLGLLLGAVTGAVFLVTDLLYGLGPSLVVGALTAAWFFWFWFVFPVDRPWLARPTTTGVSGSVP